MLRIGEIFLQGIMYMSTYTNEKRKNMIKLIRSTHKEGIYRDKNLPK